MLSEYAKAKSQLKEFLMEDSNKKLLVNKKPINQSSQQ